MTLYELTEQYRTLLDMYEDEAIDPEAVRDTLEGLDGEIGDKLDGCAAVLKELAYDAEKMKAEAKKLTERAAAVEKKRAGLIEYIKSAMSAMNMSKHESAVAALRVKANPPSVVIDDEDAFCKKYVRFANVKVQTIIKPDKAAVKAALNGGEALEGARLATGTRLEIK